MDVHLTDTYFVIAHFHYVMVGGALLGYLSGLHFWWPKMFGRMYSDVWSKVSAVLVFAGFNLTFFPQFLLGYMGMPRRYHVYPPEFQVFNVLSSAGASVLGLGLLLPAIYLTWSLKYGAPAPPNPLGRHRFWNGRRSLSRFYRRNLGYAVVYHRSLRLLNRAGGSPHWLVPLLPHEETTLKHHFANEAQQKDASTVRMWVFLVTEIMFFGGLFLAYFACRQRCHCCVR